MRKQYHHRPTPDGTKIWDVHRLVELSKDFPRIRVPLDSIKELDEKFWFEDGQTPTCREILEHVKLIHETDLKYPIILSSDGRVMDGMHRVLKAALENCDHIDAVQFDVDPEPDYMNVPLDELPYRSCITNGFS